jgi:hypothetical protein
MHVLWRYGLATQWFLDLFPLLGGFLPRLAVTLTHVRVNTTAGQNPSASSNTADFTSTAALPKTTMTTQPAEQTATKSQYRTQSPKSDNKLMIGTLLFQLLDALVKQTVSPVVETQREEGEEVRSDSIFLDYLYCIV